MQRTAVIWIVGMAVIVSEALGGPLVFADEVAELRAENAQLKARVAELEKQVAATKRVHPADVKRPTQPGPLERVVDPILAPPGLMLREAEQFTGGWWDSVREGIDRVDHFFYVDDAKAWMTAEYQFDTRGFNTINFTGASRLPAGFNLWGFIDFESADAPGNSDWDINEFFLEMDLKREIWKGFGGIAEYNEAQGRSDNVGRFGAYYAPTWAVLKQADLAVQTKWFPLGTEASRRQGSFAWNWAPRYILNGRFSMGGFWDINFDEKEGRHRPQMVIENQWRYRLLGNLHALVEYRYNEFLGKDQESGWGIGVQYRF